MKIYQTLFVLVVSFFLVTCGSTATSTTTNGDSDGASAGIVIQGVVSTSATPANLTAPFLGAPLYTMPSNCPDNAGGGQSINVSPTDAEVILATRYVRLLKEGSTTDYYEIDGCTNATAAEAKTNAVTISASASTICDLSEALSTDAVGSYDAIEMAIYYVQTTVPLVIPSLDPALADYPMRVYFNDDATSGVLARDILFYDEAVAKWGWYSYNTNGLVYLDDAGGRPASGLLDAFSNDDYWCADCAASPELCPAEADRRQCSADNATLSYKDPVTISTRDDSGGVNFSMDGVITVDSVTEAHTILMTFDVADTLTVWAGQSQIDAEETDEIDLTQSCGFHPLFPGVVITDESETE
ncbi:MAG: hypothetical protein HQM16_16575 [Deltaproteobacteria bacterium]|nr:hypothetical protein [Deltaproteobacteria bacterium]